MRYIYFIQDGGAVKIGVSKDPQERLKVLQGGNPRTLRLLGFLEGDKGGERLRHQLLEGRHLLRKGR